MKKGISTKLYIGFGSMMLLLIVMSVVTWKNATLTQDIYADKVRSTVYLANAERALWQLRYGFPQFMVLDDQGRQKIIDEEPKLYKSVNDNIKAFSDGQRTPEEREALKAWDEVFTKYAQARPRWFELYRAGKTQEAAEWRAQTTTPFGAGSVKALGNLIELQNKIGAEMEEKSKAQSRYSQIFVIGFVIFALLFGAAICLYITRNIVGALNRVIGGLSTGVGQVSSAAGQITSSSQQLAEGTSEQASSLEETSSSLEEMSSMTKQNADHANQAKAMMTEANTIVAKVNHHMQEMSGAVGEITRSSEETGKIIKTIDEIAFQTNLLALNAAVEAARAGEAGAGFAVVADEVRNLAMRASEAAKNTSNLIENTIKAVRKGNELTNATQEAFKENAEISKKIGQLVDEIATASEEQSHGITQVNTAVAEMDKVTQSTAATAEESAALSEELNAQAEQMKVYVADLVKVVEGGSANGAASFHSAPDAGHRSQRVPIAVRKALPLPEKKAGGKAAGRVQGSKAVRRPEEVIPLTGGEFKDF